MKAGCFADSSTRPDLMRELRTHFALMELATGAVGRLWLAGSFVSRKTNPEDVDVTYLIPSDAYGRATEDPDTIDELDNLGTKDWCVRHSMRVDAYVLRLPETADFRSLGVMGAMASGDHKVFEELGVHDEIWQHCRSGQNGLPGGARRGYVEVLL